MVNAIPASFQVPDFHLVDNRDAGDFHATGRVRHFVRDREIYGDGDNADHVFKVSTGIVRTYKFLRDGRRQVDAFHGPGRVFGLDVGPRYSLAAAAASDCTVISYRRAALERLGATNDRLSLQLFSSALHSLARAQEHSLSLGRRSAVEKVAEFLMGCTEYSQNAEEILLAMTRKDIADYLGLSIETVSRTFSQLEQQSLIKLTGARRVRLNDASGLRDLCA